MDIREAFDKAREIVATAIREAAEKYNRDFGDFAKAHGGIIGRTECDYEHHGDGWRRMKTYTAKDGANFYEVTQFPATKYGLLVEYWSYDCNSQFVYL